MTRPPTGRLILVPNTLDLGLAGAAAAPLSDVLPMGAIRLAAALGHWVAENAKTTRAFLKRVHEVTPLAQALQDISIVELPRPAKGRAAAPAADLAPLLAPAVGGQDMGLSSEAGMPAVADPGAALVAAAHARGVSVLPLPGPNSLMMALAASGLNGQRFAFVGYLPVPAGDRSARIRELEGHSRRAAETQIVIETPYRNGPLLDALVSVLHPTTRLSVSCGLTLASGWNRAGTVATWRERPAAMPADVPAVFIFQA
jgi:16S rRNA (cytidine1402-2'-O)-methyltransferase